MFRDLKARQMCPNRTWCVFGLIGLRCHVSPTLYMVGYLANYSCFLFEEHLARVQCYLLNNSTLDFDKAV